MSLVAEALARLELEGRNWTKHRVASITSTPAQHEGNEPIAPVATTVDLVNRQPLGAAVIPVPERQRPMQAIETRPARASRQPSYPSDANGPTSTVRRLWRQAALAMVSMFK